MTGDFQAVLQVSGATVNRLLASMHQNGFANPKKPSIPHSVRMRIGDTHAVDGVRGRVDVQIGAPLVELLDGATDRFVLDVGIRACYRPDPGTNPLPAFIHGTVRAEYRIEDIDPACPGWATLAADYLWVKVVKSSVRFQGTAREDRSLVELVSDLDTPPSGAGVASAATKIAKQIAAQLATRFEATPHYVSKRFRRGSMRSLAGPGGGSAIVIPLGIYADPYGDIASVDTIFLDGADLAIAVRSEVFMAIAQPTLNSLADFHTTAYVHIESEFSDDIDTVYHATVDPPTAAWHAYGSTAVFRIKVHGRATTNSVLPDATFDVEQDVVLSFDAMTGGLAASPGTLIVKTQASDLGSGEISGKINKAVAAGIKDIVQTACNDVQPALDALTKTEELSKQLRTLDDKAAVALNQAEFLPDAVVLRGQISVAPRHPAVVSVEKTAEQNGHSALQSWIPGGRIDRFTWSWGWSSGTPEGATFEDRFLLRRPPAPLGRWGMSVGLHTPLPGLDGHYGKVCLQLAGTQVDPVSGALVPTFSSRTCQEFGLGLAVPLHKDGRLLLRDVPELSQPAPFPELAVERSGAHPNAVHTPNTLLVYLDERWDEDTESSLISGLKMCGRFDAGLTLLVLFREGIAAASGADAIARVRRLATAVGLAALVQEDVRGRWADALDLRARAGEPAWRLIGPPGAVAWAHDGLVSGDRLGAALDRHLVRCPDASPAVVRAGVSVGDDASLVVTRDFSDLMVAPCPALPLGHAGAGSVLVFVQNDSDSSRTRLRQLSGDFGESAGGPLVVVVVDGANAREAEALRTDLHADAVVLADPSGTMTDRFGITVWPTTIGLDPRGRVTAVATGAEPLRDDRSAAE